MMTPDTTRLWSVGMFALPLVAVKLAASVLGGAAPRNAGAAPAVAATEPASPTGPGLAKIDWTAEQRTAAAHVRELGASSFGPSPMVELRMSTPPVAPEPVIEPVIMPDAPLPVFTLHAVMTAPNANKALINGRLYQVGQEVDGSGWIVDHINVDARSVTLRNQESQATMVISVQAPR